MTFQKVTHPNATLVQARLTEKFVYDRILDFSTMSHSHGGENSDENGAFSNSFNSNELLHCGRGVGNLETQIHLFNMIKTHKPDILFLDEPLMHFTSIHAWYWKRLNLHLSKNWTGTLLAFHSMVAICTTFFLNFLSRDRLGMPFTRFHMS
ncbi:transmembrane protein, putative [Medicago truncatula]|uniref:Transmembrane protein, putative n=1 Tax=Medicago truncatula TaxID=3880 RepID=A0A072UYU7_MEDTR|nr:transmembrane protein, putative [Medicago truncatula]